MTQEAPPLARSRTRSSSASDGDQFIVENPATGRPVTACPGRWPAPGRPGRASGPRRPAGTWRRRPARERGRYLRQIAELIRAHADEIAALESLEMGKPIPRPASFDVEAAISIFDYFGSLVEVLPSQARDYGPVFDVTTLEPNRRDCRASCRSTGHPSTPPERSHRRWLSAMRSCSSHRSRHPRWCCAWWN